MNPKQNDIMNFIEIQLDQSELGQNYSSSFNKNDIQLPKRDFYPRKFQILESNSNQQVLLSTNDDVLTQTILEGEQKIIRNIKYEKPIVNLKVKKVIEKNFQLIIVTLSNGKVSLTKIYDGDIDDQSNTCLIDFGQFVNEDSQNFIVKLTDQLQIDDQNNVYLVFYVYDKDSAQIQFFSVDINKSKFEFQETYQSTKLQVKDDNILKKAASFFKSAILGAKENEEQLLQRKDTIQLHHLCSNLFLIIRQDFSLQIYDIYSQQVLWSKVNKQLDEQVLDLNKIQVLKKCYDDKQNIQVIIYDGNYNTLRNDSFYYNLSIDFNQSDVFHQGVNEYQDYTENLVANVNFQFHEFRKQKITLMKIVNDNLIYNLYKVDTKINEIREVNLFKRQSQNSFFTLDEIALKNINELKILLKEISDDQYELVLKKLFSQNCFTFKDLLSSVEQVANDCIQDNANELNFFLQSNDIINKQQLYHKLCIFLESLLIQNQAYQIKSILEQILRNLILTYLDENQIIGVKRYKGRIYTFRENKKQCIFDMTIPFIGRYMTICQILNTKIKFKQEQTNIFFSQIKHQKKIILNQKNITLERMLASLLSNLSQNNEADFVYILQTFKDKYFDSKLDKLLSYKYMNLKKHNLMKIIEQLVQNKNQLQRFAQEYFKFHKHIEEYKQSRYNNLESSVILDYGSKINLMLQSVQMNYYFEADFTITLVFLLLEKLDDLISKIFNQNFLADLSYIKSGLQNKLFGYYCLNSFYDSEQLDQQNCLDLKNNKIIMYVLRDQIGIQQIQNIKGTQWLNLDQIIQNYLNINQFINSRKGFDNEENILNLFYYYLYKNNQQHVFNSNKKYFNQKDISFYYFRLLFSEKNQIYENLKSFFEIIYQNQNYEQIFVQQLQLQGNIAEFTSQNLTQDQSMQNMIIKMIIDGKIEIFDFDQLYKISIFLLTLSKDENFLQKELFMNLINKMGSDKNNQYKVLSLLSSEDQEIINAFCQKALNIDDPTILRFENLYLSEKFQKGFFKSFTNLFENLKLRVRKKNFMTLMDCSKNLKNQFFTFCRNLVKCQQFQILAFYNFLYAFQCFEILELIQEHVVNINEFLQFFLDFQEILINNCLLYQRFIQNNDTIELEINQVSQKIQMYLNDLNIKLEPNDNYLITKNDLKFISAYFKGIKQYFKLTDTIQIKQSMIVSYLIQNKDVDRAQEMAIYKEKLMRILFHFSFLSCSKQQKKYMSNVNFDTKLNNIIEAQIELLTLGKQIDEQQKDKNQMTYLKTMYEFQKKKNCTFELDITKKIEDEVFRKHPMTLITYLMIFNQEKKLKNYAIEFVKILQEINDDPTQIRNYNVNYLDTQILQSFFREIKKPNYSDKYKELQQTLEEIVKKGI